MKLNKKTIARPYARAIFNRAKSLDKLKSVKLLLSNLSELYLLKNAQKMISSRNMDLECKSNILVESLGISDVLEIRIINLLIESKRFDVITFISDVYNSLMNEHLSIVCVTVCSAYPIKNKDNICAFIEKNTPNKKADITYKIDKDIIGGIEIHIGDRVIHASVKSTFSELQA